MSLSVPRPASLLALGWLLALLVSPLAAQTPDSTGGQSLGAPGGSAQTGSGNNAAGQPSQQGLSPQGPQDQSQPEQAQRIEQGRYLVHDVAKCIVCHSPRTASGALIERRLLTGAPMPVASPFPDQEWAFRAPRIAGLPGWTDEQIITLLVTGQRPNGYEPKPPMPNFHFKPEDARAVVAYLRSLGQ